MVNTQKESCTNHQANKRGTISALFITVAGNAMGYGHLSRCLSIAEQAVKERLTVSFLLFGENSASARVEQAGFSCLLKPISALNVAGLPQNSDGLFDIVIVDFSHQNTFPDLNCARSVLVKISRLAKKVVMIDALGEQALVTKIPDMPIDILVVPYVDDGIRHGNWRTLEGPMYAVLSSAYSNLQDRTVRHDADRILVSCGGSDPKKLTISVLEGIEQIQKKLEVRVVVGPLFDETIRAILGDFISNSKHLIRLVKSPTTLAEHMMWCDLAIATTGLIKYELAATGTPGILISIDEIHDMINQPFANKGSILDLGVTDSPQLIANHATDLLSNYDARVVMARVGHQMVDGNGTKRLVDEIIGYVHI